MISSKKIRANEDLLEAVLANLDVVKGPDHRGEHTVWCPFHDDGHGKPPHNPNLSVSVRGYYCHACQAKGSLFDLAKRLGIDAAGGKCQQPEQIYDYKDENGKLLFQVLRFQDKRFRQRRPDGSGGWIWNLQGVRRVLYNLPEILSRRDEPVFVVEGEKDADNLMQRGLLATTSPGGAWKWNAEYSKTLAGRQVVILPDNDVAGKTHAKLAAASLYGRAASVKIVELEGLEEKGDVSDWLSAGHGVGELLDLAAAAPEFSLAESSDAASENSEQGSSRRVSQADRLISVVEESGTELFCDQFGEPYARIPIGGHYEIRRVRSKEFRSFLAHQLWLHARKAPGSEAIASALSVIEAKARFDGGRFTLHNRVAIHEDAIYYDLADSEWRAVKVTPDGWEVVCDPPILFRRFAHQQAQCEPGEPCDIWEIVNLTTLGEFQPQLLFLVYLVTCFVPHIAHPIAIIHGPQGAAKTTLFRIARRIVDPSATEVLTLLHNRTELVQQLSHHWMAPYDNVGDVPDHVSDILCRAVTGDGFSKRELYTDDEDVIYAFRRCVGLNGINIAARKPDLLDRALLFGLEPIEPKYRITESELWHEFEKMRPQLLAAVFDLLSKAMGIVPNVHLERHPRMADFAVWACAVTEAMGATQDYFLEAYGNDQASRNEEAISANPVAAVIRRLMEDRDIWQGTGGELLRELNELAPAEGINPSSRSWPQSAQSLSRRLNEVTPNLAAIGICIERCRSAKSRSIIIRKQPAETVTSVTSVTEAAKDARLSSDRAAEGNSSSDTSDDANPSSRSEASQAKGLS